MERINEIRPDFLYSIDAVAKILSVSPVTVRYWSRLNKIETRKLGRRRLVPGVEVLRILREGLK